MRPHAEPSHGQISFALRSFDDEAPRLLLLLPPPPPSLPPFPSFPVRLCKSGAMIFHGLRRGLIEIVSATSARLYLALLPPLGLSLSLPPFSLYIINPFILSERENTCLMTPTMIIWYFGDIA